VKNPDLYDLLGLCGVKELRKRSDYGLSLVLGTAELTMKELAVMYGMLANRGELAPLRDTLAGGGAAGDAAAARGGGAGSPARSLLTPQAAFLVRTILEQKPRPDELDAGDLRNPSRPVAWKTGTSIGFRDAWSIGIFDSFILCVWVGNFDGSGNPEFVGLRSAAPLMFLIIDAIRASGLEKDYAREEDDGEPPDVITTRVCAVSGKIPNRFCQSTMETLFIPGVSPIEVCDIHQEVFIDVKTGLRRSRPIEGKTRSVVFEIWPSDLLALFRKAGLPRRQPPPFAEDEDLTARSESGQSPQIVSPLPKGEYAVGVGRGSGDEIPLIAVVPSDTTKIFWFLDESYLGQSPRGTAYFWKPAPGSYVLRATDEHGRSASCRFTVVLRQ
jgi:penicillin-binding protein 1C